MVYSLTVRPAIQPLQHAYMASRLTSDRLLHVFGSHLLGESRTAREYDSFHSEMCEARLLLYHP